MTDFFEVLDNKHRQAIKTIKQLIDVESQEYPEYKQAAILCKFLFDSEDRYAMIEKADAFKGFYDNAQDFETLCHCIYHALTDDGDIAFVQVNNHCPVIVFESRWELKIDNLISKNEQALYERLNSFKKEKGILPLHEHKMVFFDNVYEYIEAVKQYRIDSEIQRKSVSEKLRMFKDKKKLDTPQETL